MLAFIFLSFIITIFDFYLSATNILDKCGSVLIADANPQNFSTPSYPDVYENNLNCEWIITRQSMNESILLIFFHIKTEQFYDYITVRGRS